MSIDALALSEAELARLEPAALEQHLGQLVRAYVRHRSCELADRVVQLIETLYRHPELPPDHDRFCAYRRLARHWRWLAHQTRAAAAQP